MSDETENKEVETADGEGEVQVGILGQYIKDLSFENPNPAQNLQTMSEKKPNMEMNVGLNAQQVGEEAFEVDLKITATAKIEDETVFVTELVYTGLFGLKNVPAEHMQPFLMVEAPNLLFPFARRIIADVTRDGGFPPLMLEPMNFAALYQQQMDQQAAGAESTDAVN
jgi:preprotein translocase subunit SecB